MNGQLRISVTNPITPAIDRARKILFEPFNLGKWFVIGFCAWLAGLGSAGGGHVNVPGGGGRGVGSYNEFTAAIREGLARAKDFAIDNLHWILPLAIIIVLISIILWLVLTWLSSRGRFMFLHCVAYNRAEVTIPWAQFRDHGNSLFMFRVVLGLIGFALTLLAALPGILLMASAIAPGGSPAEAIMGIIVLFLLVLVVSIPLLLVRKFTVDFVVPIMFLRTASSRAGWREFLDTLSANKARFVLYVLFQIVIAIAIGFIVIAAMCVTCCIAACIMALPYLGTVLMLPVLIFTRSYSLCYLGQYGPQFDVFALEDQQVPPAIDAPPGL